MLEGYGFGTDEVCGPEADDALPVFVGQLSEMGWLATVFEVGPRGLI